MVEQSCENCGKKFMTYLSNHRKYCSKFCAITKSWEKRERAKKVKIVCLNCKKEFELPASQTRVKNNKVHYCCSACRDEGRKNGKYIKCKYCQKVFYSTRHVFCSKKCSDEYTKNCTPHKEYLEKGYKMLYVNKNGKRYEKKHRYLMEQHLGRKLSKDEIVHHIDGNKLNNDISNLAVMTSSEHIKLHRKQDKEKGKIFFKKKEHKYIN